MLLSELKVTSKYHAKLKRAGLAVYQIDFEITQITSVVGYSLEPMNAHLIYLFKIFLYHHSFSDTKAVCKL